MQRSKQQALMFLLGAVLVGGVLGFSADRVITSKTKPQRLSARQQMYADIGVAAEQQPQMDSVLDEINCKTSEIMRSVRPSMDSVRAEGFKTLLGMLTPAQREAWDAREVRQRARMDSVEKARDADWAKKHPGSDRPRRCGPRPASGSSSGGPRPFL
jgi:hypothetical protein